MPSGDDEESPNADEGAVLSPDELDITDDERVVEIDEGRYVVSSDDQPPEAPADGDIDVDGPEPAPVEEPELTEERVREWLEAEVGDADSRYGFDVTAKFGDSVRRRELFSNDVVTTFENLVVWYAQHVGDDTPVEEALGILLTEANVPVWHPPATLQDFLDDRDLDPEDSIADLMAAVGEDEGFRLPVSSTSRRRR